MHDGPGGQGLSRKAILEQVDASLARLGTDYIDLYQIHRFDPDAPAEETMEALHDVVKAGKVRYIGASSMYAWQFAKLQHAAELRGWTPFVSMQNQYNLLRRQDEPELMAMCADMGVGVVPYSPQGKGRLARPWGDQSHRSTVDHVVQSFDSPLDEPVVKAVQRVSEARGATMAQVALAWVLKNPVVSAPIVGATKPHHLPEAIAALDLRLTGEEIESLEQPYATRAVFGSDRVSEPGRADHFLGIDLGGSTVRASLIDASGTIFDQVRTLLPDGAGPQAAGRAVTSRNYHGAVTATGMAVAGTVRDGVLNYLVTQS